MVRVPDFSRARIWQCSELNLLVATIRTSVAASPAVPQNLRACIALKLMQHLRANGGWTPIVCPTGLPDPDERLANTVFRAGARTTLYKLFEVEELLRQVESNSDHAQKRTCYRAKSRRCLERG